MLGKFLLGGMTVFAAVTWAAASSTHTVIMKSISYDPKILEIRVGESVDWENKSYTEHSATADDSGFDTALIPPGKKTKKIEFSKAGIYKYHCSMHGKAMSGQIVVKD